MSSFDVTSGVTPFRILLQVTGSIGAFKSVALCSKLVQAGYEIEVVLSRGAEEFVGAASFEGFTHRKVHRGNFDEGSMMAHIDLERWADLILLYPATANTIADLASAKTDSLIGAIFLAHEFKKPYWVVPAMNQAMLAHPANQAHFKKLTEWGLKVFSSTQGQLACGEIGAGRLIEPEAILGEIQKYFSDFKRPTTPSPKPLLSTKKQNRILITSGGTSEPIDAVRSITNFSSGKTGFTLAQYLQLQGHAVTLIQAKSSLYQASTGIHYLNYTTTQEFAKILETQLRSENYDTLIHAAAVADYSVESVLSENGKNIDRDSKIQQKSGLLLKLKSNPKIIQFVRGWSKNKTLKIISFKLTQGEKSSIDFSAYDSEWIIHNDLSQISETQHRGEIFKRTPDGKYLSFFHFQDKIELCREVNGLLTRETV